MDEGAEALGVMVTQVSIIDVCEVISPLPQLSNILTFLR